MKDFLKRYINILTLALLCLISFLGIWTSERSSLVSPREIGATISSFFQQGSSSVGGFLKSLFTSVQELSTIKQQYNSLQEKLALLEQEKSDQEQLRLENQRLKTVLQFADSLGYKNIPAQIIAKDPGIIFNTLTLNKGHNEGIKKDMPVLAVQDDILGLVGKVASVSAHSAQVLPIFDARSYIAARISGSRHEGLLIGNGINDMKMVYVDLEAKSSLKVGDPIITSGLNSLFPSNILIGKVSGINSKPYEMSLEFEVKPYLKFTRLEYVYVVTYEL